MKIMKNLLALLLLFAVIIPAQAATDARRASDGEPPLLQASVRTSQTRSQAQPEPIKHPSKAEIVLKRQTVTSSKTTFNTSPSVVAPYATGSLTDEYLETGTLLYTDNKDVEVTSIENSDGNITLLFKCCIPIFLR